jgi:hypothetical protein
MPATMHVAATVTATSTTTPGVVLAKRRNHATQARTSRA